MAIKELGLAPDDFTLDDRQFTEFITHPDFFSFFVAFLAGMRGRALADVGQVRRADRRPHLGHDDPGGREHRPGGRLRRLDEWRGAMAQLSVNLTMIVLAGVGTLYVQRLLYRRRRIKHLSDPAREKAGLPVGGALRSDRRAER